jgi:hypothetical protein
VRIDGPIKIGWSLMEPSRRCSRPPANETEETAAKFFASPARLYNAIRAILPGNQSLQDQDVAVNLFDRVEQTFERAVEGSIGRVFRSQVQPAEIGRKLERAMTTHQLVGVESTLVPNDYKVYLNPKDLAPFAGFLPGLCRQMEAWLQEVVEDRGFSTIDRIRVQIEASDSAPRRAIGVSATTIDRPPTLKVESRPVQETQIFQLVRQPSGRRLLTLSFQQGPHAGSEFVIRKQSVTVGRSLDNDLVLDSPDVSRRHARIEATGATLMLTDLDSTNGTKVNGRTVRTRAIAVGDEVTFGLSTAVVSTMED